MLGFAGESEPDYLAGAVAGCTVGLDEMDAQPITRLVRSPATVPQAGHSIRVRASSGKEMYVIKAGDVSVYIKIDDKEKEIVQLHKGNFFGEVALMQHAKRGAFIKTLTYS